MPEEEKGAEKQSNIVIHVPNIKLFEMFRFNNIPARVDSAGTTTSEVLMLTQLSALLTSKLLG